MNLKSINDPKPPFPGGRFGETSQRTGLLWFPLVATSLKCCTVTWKNCVRNILRSFMKRDFKKNFSNCWKIIQADQPPCTLLNDWATGTKPIYTWSGKTFAIPAHTRSIIQSGRYCWHNGWVRKESLQKPGLDSTVWLQQQSVLKGVECIVYMGEKDIEQQAPNVAMHENAWGQSNTCYQWQQDIKRRNQRSYPWLDQ